jgi:hypothetical protein
MQKQSIPDQLQIKTKVENKTSHTRPLPQAPKEKANGFSFALYYNL